MKWRIFKYAFEVVFLKQLNHYILHHFLRGSKTMLEFFILLYATGETPSNSEARTRTFFAYLLPFARTYHI